MAKATDRIQSAKFLLCEDIREELRSKLSVMGVFAGDRIDVHGPSPLPDGKGVAMLHSLGLVSILRGKPGKFDVEMTIQGPKGVLIGNGKFNDTVIGPDGVATLILRLPSFVVPAFGQYEARFVIGKQTLTFEFEILAAQTAAASA